MQHTKLKSKINIVYLLKNNKDFVDPFNKIN
jgi:hypothetical protein